MSKDNTILLMFFACYITLFLVIMHAVQQKKINELQVEIDELRLVLNERFISSMILDKENLMLR